MSTPSSSGQSTLDELRQFHAFVGAQVNAQREGLTPEDVIDLWRDRHPSLDDSSGMVAAVNAALADLDAGHQGVPLDEFDREFRQRHGLPPRP
jgi:L-alanine-DL-glutamate epimerase-like enolase superfamily enzyme